MTAPRRARPLRRNARLSTAPRRSPRATGSTSSSTPPPPAAAPPAGPGLNPLASPAGSLGALEGLIERWASITGAPPPASLRAGVLVCAADHGHVGRGTSLYGADVSAQVAAAAAGGETAVGVLARAGGHELLVADVGLAAPTPEGVRDAKVRAGTADMVEGAALTGDDLDGALAAGARLARELAERGVGCLALGEIGMGNTATTAALLCALTGASPAVTVGRGTGLDAPGLERKSELVAAASARHGAPLGAREALLAVGGLELAALAGAACEAARRRLPVILDGYPPPTAAPP